MQQESMRLRAEDDAKTIDSLRRRLHALEQQQTSTHPISRTTDHDKEYDLVPEHDLSLSQSLGTDNHDQEEGSSLEEEFDAIAGFVTPGNQRQHHPLAASHRRRQLLWIRAMLQR
eukprot:SAG31_NODE_3397_length_4316_cov_48.192317_3_plen_115_part_00